MKVIIGYKGDQYDFFRIIRNNEGGLIGNLNITHPNKDIVDLHFTYPCNGRYHYTLILTSGLRVLFFKIK